MRGTLGTLGTLADQGSGRRHRPADNVGGLVLSQRAGGNLLSELALQPRHEPGALGWVSGEDEAHLAA